MKSLSRHAQAAKLIREELKKAFPTIKFRVTSDSFSMGSSVDIYWNNGPTSLAIKQIVDKYEYGKFDGMTDTYEMNNTNPDLPQVKYVQENRSITEDVYNTAYENLPGCFKTTKYLAEERIYYFLSKHDLTNGFKKEMFYN